MTFNQRHYLWLLVAMAAFGPHSVAGQEKIDWSRLPDFSALRQEIGESTDFYSRCESNEQPESNKQIVAHLNSENWEAAARSAEARLQACPVDIEMHFYASIALEELNRVGEAQHHIDWRNGLIDSVLASGDGRMPETAFVTISVNEEYAILRAFGLTPKSQALVGNRDQFVVTDRSGEESEIFFYPELHWKRMEALFSR